jgi:putative selenium metabolism hydrolase
MTKKQTLSETEASDDLLAFAQGLVRIQSYSGQEEQAARFIESKMRSLGYDEVRIDRYGNVIGRAGSGPQVILFDAHMDTVRVDDEPSWEVAPFSGTIDNGWLWGRGSVDMKSGLAAAVYAAGLARRADALSGKTVYVTCTVIEEDCDGEGLRLLLKENHLKPDYAVICEPSSNTIVTGHKGKAQVIVRTRGRSAHGSAPEKGVNAIYAMDRIIQRVEQANLKLAKKESRRASLAMTSISSKGVSLNAVPAQCEAYLDRRIIVGETEQGIREEMQRLVDGKDASWEFDTVRRTTWTGEQLVYEPFHLAWETSREHPITRAFMQACQDVTGILPDKFDYWDFSTDAVAVVDLGVPTLGFGPGEYKLAHMRDECCETRQITEACAVYRALINRL